MRISDWSSDVCSSDLVVTGQVDLLLLEQPRFVRIGVDRAGQRGAECGHVRAAVALRDVVGEGEDVLIIAVVPFERDLDADIVALAGDRSEEHTSELQSLMRISYDVFCLTTK